MIDSKIVVEDLEPRLWCHLQEILDLVAPPERVLHILIQDGRVHAVSWDKKLVRIPMEALKREEDLWRYAQDAGEIRIYTPKGLEAYDRKIQSPEIFQMDIDEYMEYLSRELENTQGMVRYRRGVPKPELFTILRQWMREDGIYLFWLTRGTALYFNCIFQIKDGKLVLLSTSGRYPKVWEELEKVYLCLEEEFGSRVHRVIMDYEELKEKR